MSIGMIIVMMMMNTMMLWFYRFTLLKDLPKRRKDLLLAVKGENVVNKGYMKEEA
jgi:hypothetical protein